MGIKTVNSNIPYNLSLVASKFLPIFGGGAIIMCNFYISITSGWIWPNFVEYNSIWDDYYI